MPLTEAAAAAYDRMWSDLEPLGRDARTGGYRRCAWTRTDAVLGEWFAGEASRRGLDLVVDRAGNQWAWWGDPDAAARAGNPGLVLGSHLDSVPDGGAYDGPLGVVSALAAVDALRAVGRQPTRPLGIVRFVDEEGARFGVACTGSRVLTGSMAPAAVLGLRDADGTSVAEAMTAAGHDPGAVGRDDETLARVGAFVELHVEQGRQLVDLGRAVGVGSLIWPHGRWRLELRGAANHAGTTRLADREDPMLDLAAVVTAARARAERLGCVATVGKVRVEPNGVNAIPSRVLAWLDARGPDEADVRRLAEEVAAAGRTAAVEESWTGQTTFDAALRDRIAGRLDDAPLLATGAGHDAGILAAAGVPTAMVYVRNPTGVSHAPSEHADRADCLAGVGALVDVVEELAG